MEQEIVNSDNNSPADDRKSVEIQQMADHFHVPADHVSELLAIAEQQKEMTRAFLNRRTALRN